MGRLTKPDKSQWAFSQRSDMYLNVKEKKKSFPTEEGMESVAGRERSTSMVVSNIIM